MVFIIWNFERDKFKSGHRLFKANWVLESIVVRLKVIFIFLTRARDTMEECNISTDVMYSEQFESTASAQCTR